MKKEKKTKEKKKKDPNALKTVRVISNNFYVLKLIHSVAPAYLPTYYLWTVGNAVFDFLMNTWLLREVVNRYSLGRPLKEIIGLLVVLVSVQLVWFVAIDMLTRLIYPKFQQKIVEKIESDLFRKASRVELECYENPDFYDKYVKAMDGAYSHCMDVVYTVDGMLWAVVSLITVSVMMIVIDPLILLFSLIPLLFGLIRNSRNRLNKARNDERKKIERREGYVQRTFYLNEYAKEMRLSGMPSLMFRKYEKAQNDYIAINRKYGFKAAVLRFFSDSGAHFVSFAAMVYAAFRTLVSHTMLLGDCLVVFNSVETLSWSLTNFVTSMNEFRDHAMYIEDYRFFMEYEPKLRRLSASEGKKAVAGELAVSDVSFTYTGAEKPALEHISFTVKPGEKIALVGHNGSGKTTLVKLLLRLYEPTEGKITLNGTNIGEYASDSYRDAFTTVFQDFRIFSLSVAENVLLRPLEEGDEARVTEALKKSGAWEKISSLPDGIHTTLTREFDDKGTVLSGGEAQKVTLARAFTNDSPFVILDEPSSALDPIAEYEMFRNMMEACKNRTLIFISHRLSSAVLADRVILLDGGRIAETGTHGELMAKNGTYADMFRKQAENYADSLGDTESGVSGNA